jgi:hypothetical protein
MAIFALKKNILRDTSVETIEKKWFLVRCNMFCVLMFFAIDQAKMLNNRLVQPSVGAYYEMV